MRAFARFVVRVVRRAATRALETHVVLPLIVVVLLAAIWSATFSLENIERLEAQRAAVTSVRDLPADLATQLMKSCSSDVTFSAQRAAS